MIERQSGWRLSRSAEYMRTMTDLNEIAWMRERAQQILDRPGISDCNRRYQEWRIGLLDYRADLLRRIRAARAA